MPSTALSAKLSLLFNCADDENAIIAAATKANGAFASLETMMKDYGASDPADLVKKAGDAAKKATMAAEAGGKLAELLAALDGGAQEEAKQESEQIAASMGFKAGDERGTGARHIIRTEGLTARRAALGIVASEVEGKLVLSLGAKDPSKFEAFRKNYPLPDAKKQQAVVLTTPLAAGAGGVQLGGPHTGLPAAGATGTTEPNVPEHIAALSMYPGANNVAKAIAMLSDKNPGFKTQPWAEQNRIAGNFVLTGKAA